jgi:hypothetical protein
MISIEIKLSEYDDNIYNKEYDGDNDDDDDDDICHE